MEGAQTLQEEIRNARKAELIDLGLKYGVELNPRTRKADLFSLLVEELVERDILRPEALNMLPKKNEDLWKIKQLEIESSRQVELARIEADKQVELAKTKEHKPGKVDVQFDLAKYTRLLPEFDERNPDLFFDLLERLAKQMMIGEEHWVTLAQSRLSGKAIQVYWSLADDQLSYQSVREKILLAYEQVPAAHLKQFRELKKKVGESFAEFASQMTRLADRWLRAAEAQTFDKLREQVLIEQFLSTLEHRIKLYIMERKPESVKQAATLADEYVLIYGSFKHDQNRHHTHTNKTGTPTSSHSTNTIQETKTEGKGDYYPSNKCKKSYQGHNGPTQGYGHGYSDLGPTCYYCHKPGHTVAFCRKKNRDSHKPVMSYSSKISPSESKRKQTPEKMTSEPVKSPESSTPVLSSNVPSETLNNIDKRFLPYITTGTIAISNTSKEPKQVTILRDTGAIQSLILTKCLINPTQTYTHEDVIIDTLAGVRKLPLHKLYLETKQFSGEVTLASVSEMPVKGIELLLSNDIVEGIVKNLVVSETPVEIPTDEVDATISPNCVVTRSQTGQGTDRDTPAPDTQDLDDTLDLDVLFERQVRDGHDVATPTDASSLDAGIVSRGTLIKLQAADVSLDPLRERALSKVDAESMTRGYYMNEGVLMRKWMPRQAPLTSTWMAVRQIVAPSPIRRDLLKLAHDTPLAGHVGIRKTLSLVTKHFYWPKIQMDVARYCKTCITCQKVGKPNKPIPKAPLCPVPAITEPFSKVLIDCVGPLPPSKAGSKYLLTIMCLSTRFPEAIPLRNIRAKTVVKALLKYFTTMGFPREIQSDRGSNFMSGHFEQALEQLGILHTVSTPYHPESQGAVERFHGTLKTMIKKYVLDYGPDWEAGLPLLLFAARSTVQESLGFSPAELVFGHDVRGPIKMLKEQWLDANPEGLDIPQKINRIKAIWQIARDNLTTSQGRMKKYFDRNVKVRSFERGDQVLLYLPKPGESLQASFQGPYTVLEKVSSLNYVIETPDRRKKTRLCHINALKKFHAPQAVLSNHIVEDQVDSILYHPDIPLKNTKAVQELPGRLKHLDPPEQHDILDLVHQYTGLFTDIPRQHSDIVHDIILLENSRVRQAPYRLNPEKREILRKEVNDLLSQGLIEPSLSPYASPCLLVPKPDGSKRLVVDYRKLNAITKADAYPLPRIDDLIDFVGTSKFVSKIDLLKGYHQICLHSDAREKTAFCTPEGLYQFRVLPFGLRNAPATFQRMINNLIAGMPGVKSYIDDLIVCSETWGEHMALLRELFSRAEEANLTINLEKSDFGHAKIAYLGHLVGNSTFSPLEMKVQAIQNLPVPQSRRDIRRFLGCVGFFRKFCKNFATISEPLTRLLRKEVKFKWDERCQSAFAQLKLLLMEKPVLRTPDFNREYHLFTDSSDVASGAVLMQEHNNVCHTVAYYSKQHNAAQRNYSTVEKECLAVVNALKHFEAYINPTRTLHLHTDHNPLVSLKRLMLTKSNPRLVRWSLLLQGYDLAISHVKGKDNILADTLSRPKCQENLQFSFPEERGCHEHQDNIRDIQD